MELATVSDLQGRMPGVDAGLAQAALNSASALVRAIARQDFDFQSQRTYVLEGGARDLVLPQRPVQIWSQQDVTAGRFPTVEPLTVVEMDDLQRIRVARLEHTHFSVVGDRLRIRWRRQWQPSMQLASQNWLWYQSYPLGVWAPLVEVTYSHGYLTPPAWLTALVLNAAMVYATNPHGLHQETVGGITLVWKNQTVRGPSQLVDQIKAELKAVGLRRGGAFSIQTA